MFESFLRRFEQCYYGNFCTKSFNIIFLNFIVKLHVTCWANSIFIRQLRKFVTKNATNSKNGVLSRFSMKNLKSSYLNVIVIEVNDLVKELKIFILNFFDQKIGSNPYL